MPNEKQFTFAISLSVLDHLGRNLYRSFATVLGEAISNSWDADADNVWIYIDKEKGSFFIKDDGDGMTWDDFQNKFLKIGYSKRKQGETYSSKRRPYIGRKGIGKLALLSCADRIHVISKVADEEYVGGIIDNAGLDKAITEDLKPQEYVLRKVDMGIFREYTKKHRKGTIIYFENIKEGIKSSLEHLRKIIALSFRFSLIDNSFRIFLDDKEITFDDIADLTRNTQLLWNINELNDPYVKEILVYKKENKKKENLQKPPKHLTIDGDIKGFIASVVKPAHLKIIGLDEKVGVDLFVNGRLREKDILRHIPTARVVESYLYGQVHYDDLDDNEDRFSTNREGIVANDQKFRKFLEKLKEVIDTVLKDWDKLRRNLRLEGDPEDQSLTPKERKAEELFNLVSEEFELPEDTKHPEHKEKVEGWVDSLAKDAQFNFTSYADCFVSENLVRKYIEEKGITITPDLNEAIQKLKSKESEHKSVGNISIELRQGGKDISYLDMDPLAKLIDPQRGHASGLTTDAKQYKPIRDALMHTALLTIEAKDKLTSVFQNIKGRVKTLLSSA